MIANYRARLIDDAEKRAQQGCTRSMCYLHLIDLKRAGHSPTKTELNIPEGHTPARVDTLYEHGSTSVAGWLITS